MISSLAYSQGAISATKYSTLTQTHMSLYVDLQLHGSLYQHFDSRHECTDFRETTATHDVRMVRKRSLVIVLLDRLHYLMQPG